MLKEIVGLGGDGRHALDTLWYMVMKTSRAITGVHTCTLEEAYVGEDPASTREIIW